MPASQLEIGVGEFLGRVGTAESGCSVATAGHRVAPVGHRDTSVGNMVGPVGEHCLECPGGMEEV